MFIGAIHAKSLLKFDFPLRMITLKYNETTLRPNINIKARGVNRLLYKLIIYVFVNDSFIPAPINVHEPWYTQPIITVYISIKVIIILCI